MLSVIGEETFGGGMSEKGYVFFVEEAGDE